MKNIIFGKSFMSVLIVCHICCMTVFANVDYPYIEDYPDGVTSASDELFSNSEIPNPIKTGFETQEDIKLVNDDSSGCLEITEDSHSGEFALKVSVNTDDYITVKDSGLFYACDENSVINEISDANDNWVKSNTIKLKIKPMNQSDTLRFYTKIVNDDDSESYVLIKSDADGDGTFKVGEDFGRGKWQDLTLSLKDADFDYSTNAIHGLYITGNTDSVWIFDDITSEWIDASKTEIDIDEFANSYLTTSDGSLKFAANKNDTGKFAIYPTITTAGTDISGDIASVSIDASVATQTYSDNVNAGTKLKEIDASSDKCDLSACSGIVDKVMYRTGYGDEQIYGISAKADSEKRYRIIIEKLSAGTIKVTSDSGSSYTLSSSNIVQYTPWYTEGVSITWGSSKCGVVRAVEYEPLTSETTGALLKKNQSVTYNLDNMSTSDRVKVSFNSHFYNAIPGIGYVGVDVYDANNELVYSTMVQIDDVIGINSQSCIIPKLDSASKITLTNYTDASSTSANNAIAIYDFSVSSITDWDVRYELAFKNHNKITGIYYPTATQTIGEFAGEENKYAVLDENAYGSVYTGTSYRTYSNSSAELVVLYVYNRSTSPQYVTDAETDGNRYYLPYGAGYVVVPGTSAYLPPSPDVAVIMATYYHNSTYILPGSDVYPVFGARTYAVSDDGDSFYYASMYDNTYLYKFDVINKTSVKICDIACSGIITVSADENMLAFKGSSDYHLYNVQTGVTMNIPDTYSFENIMFDCDNNLIMCSADGLFLYRNGELVKFDDGEDNAKYYMTKGRNGFIRYYNNDGSYIKIYIKTDSGWAESAEKSLSEDYANIMMSEDLTTLYMYDGGIYQYDIATDILGDPLMGSAASLVDMCNNGELLVYYETCYYTYNPITGIRVRITPDCENMGDIVRYNAFDKCLTYVTPSKLIGKYITYNQNELEKYLLSFDGRNSWYAFKGGRWIKASESVIPLHEEIEAMGMSASEVNSITKEDFKKVYSLGFDVLTLDVAIYMNSPTVFISPQIKSVSCTVSNKETLAGIYSTNIQRYNKSDYLSVNSMFPVENFYGLAECRYLMYIGEDWLYTYKDGKLIRLDESASELLGDIDSNWIKMKQYGMSAGELRRVPEDVMNNLFVNGEYSNTEFGIIYVVRTILNNFSDFKVDFRMQAVPNHLSGAIEGIEVSLITAQTPLSIPAELCTGFLNWFNNRQNGIGSDFYVINYSDRVVYMNYYMIQNVSVVSGSTGDDDIVEDSDIAVEVE